MINGLIDPLRAMSKTTDLSGWATAQAGWAGVLVSLLALLASLIAISVAVLAPLIQAKKDERRAAAVFAIVTDAVTKRLESLIEWEREHARDLARSSTHLALGDISTLLLRMPFEKLGTAETGDFLTLVALCGTGASIWLNDSIASEEKIIALTGMIEESRRSQRRLIDASVGRRVR